VAVAEIEGKLGLGLHQRVVAAAHHDLGAGLGVELLGRHALRLGALGACLGRIGGILEIGRMHALDMERVHAVLMPELPVRIDLEILSARHDGHGNFGLVDDVVDVFLGARQIVRQRHRVGVEVDEPEASILFEARHMHEAAAVVLVAFGIGALLWNAAQAAVGAEHPAVIEALKYARFAGLLPADAAAAMGAEIVEDADLSTRVTVEDEVAAGDCAGDERARLSQFAVMAAVEPAALEDLLVLEVEHILIGEDAARNLEGSGILIHPHLKRRSDVLVHGGSSGASGNSNET
jgi:hypothetical protein